MLCCKFLILCFTQVVPEAWTEREKSWETAQGEAKRFLMEKGFFYLNEKIFRGSLSSLQKSKIYFSDALQKGKKNYFGNIFCKYW
jgi:hypothetical protein